MPRDSNLLGTRTEGFGPAAGAAEAFLDFGNKMRYGMGEGERSQLIGRLPGSPPYGPEAERYTSSYLFAKQNPGLASIFGRGANAITDKMYGTDYADAAARGREAGAGQRQSEMQGGPNLTSVVSEEQRRRNAAAAGPQASVDVTSENFHIDPAALNPSVPKPTPIIPAFLTPPPNNSGYRPPTSAANGTFDAAFDDFFGDRNNNTSGTAGLDPFAGGDPYGDPTFGTVDPGTYGNREGLPEFDDEGQGPDPEHESGINPAEPTPEEKQFMNEEYRQNRRDIAGQDPVLAHILGLMGGGGGGNNNGPEWF